MDDVLKVHPLVILAKAGILLIIGKIPACAGMTIGERRMTIGERRNDDGWGRNSRSFKASVVDPKHLFAQTVWASAQTSNLCEFNRLNVFLHHNK